MPSMSSVRSSSSLLVLAVVTLAGPACGKRRVDKGEVKVAAASDLQFAFEELAVPFQKTSGLRLTFNFHSTGLLAKQITEGARYDLFAAANESFVDKVVAAGVCDGATKAHYARGRVAVWSPKDGVTPAATLADLADPRFKKIAIANPEHAPYGKAAKEALQQAGVWDAIESRIVFGENVTDTLRWARSGNAEVALVALSLAIVTEKGSYFLVDDQLHAPIDQALVVCNRGGNAEGARAFASFVGSPEGRAVMRKFGFLLPGEKAVTMPAAAAPPLGGDARAAAPAAPR